MGRGAPYKKGLDYYPRMTNFFEDDKIFDLLDRYGPLGTSIYEATLDIVWSQGYYAEMSDDKLARMVIRKIGSKWTGSKKAVVQVIRFCAATGLLDEELLSRGIITSVGIQKRYYTVCIKQMKRQLYNDEYWLLDYGGNEEPLVSVRKNGITSEENRINSEINRFSSEESALKEKENKNIYNTAPPDTPFSDPELEEAFQLFLTVRKHNGADLLPEQVKLLREELLAIGKDDRDRIAIAKKAAASNWKSFYPTGKSREPKSKANGGKQKNNTFNNFDQRKYDFEDLERKLTI